MKKHSNWIIRSDALAIPLRDESVDCVVTSPPYWGLRDYGVAGQLGLEATPADYVAAMVAVFRESWRVLRPAGTLWLNLGDSYSTQAGEGKVPGGGGQGARWARINQTRDPKPSGGREPMWQPNRRKIEGLKPKDLVGIPWRVAFALQADGWWLRSDIVWAKPNPMPESVTDRPTRAHEYLFLLTKSARYWYDAEAIAEPAIRAGDIPGGRKYVGNGMRFNANGKNGASPVAESRNARSVWTIATQPYSGAHFATFPEEIARRCIRAGCPKGGIVLDPFAGSGTVGRVAIQEGRSAILCDLAYQDLAVQRTREVQPSLVEIA
jgi:DNA modification methylase